MCLFSNSSQMMPKCGKNNNLSGPQTKARFVQFQTNKFQGLFKDFSRTNYSFQGQRYINFNKSTFFNPLWSPYCLKYIMQLFTLFTSSAIIDHIFYFTLLSATRLCKMTGYDLQLHLRYRNSIWNKETEIKYCSCTKIFKNYVTCEFYRFLHWEWAKFSLAKE